MQRHTKKILVIDDEPDFVEATRALLVSSGFEVFAALDGLNGLKLAKSEQPDLILCDLMMSPIDGFMTLSILRQQADTAHIPFAIISGRREVEAVRKGMLMGADEYITKPYTAEELTESVNGLFKAQADKRAAAGLLIRDLRTQLGAPVEPHVTEAMNRILDQAASLRKITRADQQITAGNIELEISRELGVLTRAISNARLLAQIEKVAANTEAMRILPEAETAELSPIVEGEFKRTMKRLGGQNKLVLDLDPATVKIGPLPLARLLEELARNAIQYSAPYSDITVRSRQIDQFVQLDVSNESERDLSGHTTIQMRREDFEAVLPPEFSHGLGLKVAHNLVALHGGRLSIRRPGVSKVCIHLNLPA